MTLSFLTLCCVCSCIFSFFPVLLMCAFSNFFVTNLLRVWSILLVSFRKKPQPFAFVFYSIMYLFSISLISTAILIISFLLLLGVYSIFFSCFLTYTFSSYFYSSFSFLIQLFMVTLFLKTPFFSISTNLVSLLKYYTVLSLLKSLL